MLFHIGNLEKVEIAISETDGLAIRVPFRFIKMNTPIACKAAVQITAGKKGTAHFPYEFGRKKLRENLSCFGLKQDISMRSCWSLRSARCKLSSSPARTLADSCRDTHRCGKPNLHSDRFFLRISEKIVIFGQNGRILKNHLTNGSC